MNLGLRDIIYENYGLKCHINEFTIKIMVIYILCHIHITLNIADPFNFYSAMSILIAFLLLNVQFQIFRFNNIIKST